MIIQEAAFPPQCRDFDFESVNPQMPLQERGSDKLFKAQVPIHLFLPKNSVSLRHNTSRKKTNRINF